MYPTLELARARHVEVRHSAEHAAFVRRVVAAKRWQRRAEAANRRARSAAAAIR
jgi:hypothetical protein